MSVVLVIHPVFISICGLFCWVRSIICLFLYFLASLDIGRGLEWSIHCDDGRWHLHFSIWLDFRGISVEVSGFWLQHTRKFSSINCQKFKAGYFLAYLVSLYLLSIDWMLMWSNLPVLCMSQEELSNPTIGQLDLHQIIQDGLKFLFYLFYYIIWFVV